MPDFTLTKEQVDQLNTCEQNINDLLPVLDDCTACNIDVTPIRERIIADRKNLAEIRKRFVSFSSE